MHPMTLPEKMVVLAGTASQMEARPADAAAILIDAAAMLGLDAGLDPQELHDRLTRAWGTLAEAHAVVGVIGNAAARKQ
jgi:hypothetical protein